MYALEREPQSHRLRTVPVVGRDWVETFGATYYRAGCWWLVPYDRNDRKRVKGVSS